MYGMFQVSDSLLSKNHAPSDDLARLRGPFGCSAMITAHMAWLMLCWIFNHGNATASCTPHLVARPLWFGGSQTLSK